MLYITEIIYPPMPLPTACLPAGRDKAGPFSKWDWGGI